MKFIKTKVITKIETPVNPKSQAFVDAVIKILEENGMTDEIKRKQCAHALFQATIKFYRKLTGGREVTTEMIKDITDKMKEILTKHGVDTNAEQELIIVDYFSILTNLGMEK